jgi:D-3-phosphoglycerate dehydrogenase
MKLARKGECRIAMINRNVPDMVGKVSRILGEASINIHHMVNDSKGDVAYTLMDVDSQVDADTFGLLSDIEGVLRVRLL